MITPDLAMWILIGLAALLLIIIPLLDSTEKFSKIISMRWTCTAIILILMVAVVVDFEHLSEETRSLILKGGLIVVGAFILLRSVEKVLLKGYLKNIDFQGTIQKGDVQATVSLTSKDNNEVEDSEEKEQHQENNEE
jgi:hypothetical protein